LTNDCFQTESLVIVKMYLQYILSFVLPNKTWMMYICRRKSDEMREGETYMFSILVHR